MGKWTKVVSSVSTADEPSLIEHPGFPPQSFRIVESKTACNLEVSLARCFLRTFSFEAWSCQFLFHFDYNEHITGLTWICLSQVCRSVYASSHRSDILWLCCPSQNPTPKQRSLTCLCSGQKLWSRLQKTIVT